jgi:hypothetical protein
MVRIASRAGVSHLQELARHVHADKIAASAVIAEQAQDRRRRFRGQFRRAKTPVRQDLALVGFHQQHALLASPDAVPLGLLAKVDAREGQRIIELRGH